MRKMNNIMNEILVVDDDKNYRESLCSLFKAEGYRAQGVSSAEDAIAVTKHKYYSVIVTDMMMEGMDGIGLLKSLKNKYNQEIEIILVTGYGSIETAVEAIKMGAFGYFIKGHDPAELISEIHKAFDSIELRKQKYYGQLNNERMVLDSKNPEMEKIWALIDAVADSNANVLITGESGTGKEIVAKQIHKLSGRSAKPFLPINCQSLPSSLIESELFGHEKGAFTGANDLHIGKFEECAGGTLFLDEIGDMTKEVQVKLLRVLESRSIERIGSNKAINVDFRVITATNKELDKEIADGRFREDLMYRINTFEVHLPPLRKRREDIPAFVDCFIDKYSKETGKPISGVDAATKDFLLSYEYPGNIRELKNIIERLVILSRSDGVLSIQYDKQDVGLSPDSYDNSQYETYKNAKTHFERSYIIEMLDSVDGNITKAAEKMELSRRQLFNKIKELDIDT